MPVELRCPCGRLLRVADEYAGRQGTCPACGALLEIPPAEKDAAGPGLAGPPEAEGVTTAPAVTPRFEPGDTGLPEYENAPDLPNIAPPAYKLSSAGEVFAGTFLLGPLAGISLIAWNYLVLGHTRAFVLTLLAGLGLAAVVAALVPGDGGIGIVVGVAAVCWLVVPLCARALQGRAFDDHLARGGATGTTGRILGLGLCSFAVWMGVFFAVGMLRELLALSLSGSDQFVRGNFEVAYSGGASKSDAERLAAYLSANWAAAPGRVSVQIKKADEGYLFRVVVKKEFQADKKNLKDLEFEAARISRDVFGGAAVQLEACDEYFRTVQVLPPRPDTRYGIVRGNAELFFATGVNQKDAERLADFLSGMVGGAPSRVTFKLARRGETVEVHLVFRQELLKDRNVIASLHADLDNIAANVFPGAAVEMHLCDDSLNPVKILKR